MKKFFQYTTLAIVLLASFSCDKLSDYKNTQWKLVAYIDEQKAIVPEPEYLPDGRSYSLVFDDTQEAVLHIPTAAMRIRFSEKQLVGEREAFDYDFYGNGGFLWDVAHDIDSYLLEENEIRLFCNNKKSYFLFKPLVR
jgi:hypothetical protein